MAKTEKNIIRYRKTRKWNIGIVVFAVIFLYLTIMVIRYIMSPKIKMYEVLDGDIANTAYYTGVILREETLVTSDYAGYVNYYLREKQKAAVGDLIYTVDESGSVMEYLNNTSGNGSRLSDENLKELKKQLSDFSAVYSDNHFSEVYDINAKLSSMLMEYMNVNTLHELNEQNAGEISVSFRKCPATASGIVLYSTDGMEGLTPEQISAETFSSENYKKTIYTGGMLVNSGSPVYRMITGDGWSVVIPLTEEDLALYQEKNTVSVRFPQKDLMAEAGFSIVRGADGASYGVLTLNQYMVQFADERFVEIEIKTSQVEGLKIPKTALVNREAFVIPLEYLTTGGNSSAEGFYKEIYREDGSVSTEFVAADIFRITDHKQDIENKGTEQQTETPQEYCYISTDNFSTGDMIILPDSNERFRVAEKETLTGVYNVNRGYASFRYINIIDENNEYCIAEKNVYYSLRTYDHIALHGSSISEGEVLH
ncbi:MAG: hypothetical protein HFI68_01985 [Lachnospiraceae bacterium]|nr:hypothetical protein [Lachnospiraceae bacterium]